MFCQKRTLYLNGERQPRFFMSNKVNNQKYNVISFIPKVLYHEFKYFFNMFFLGIALSQFVPFLKVGFMFTYIAPLVFVLAVTMLKEAYDDCKRMNTDRNNNNEKFQILQANGSLKDTASKNFKVGNIVRIEQGMRVPADLILLKTSSASGNVFIKTD